MALRLPKSGPLDSDIEDRRSDRSIEDQEKEVFHEADKEQTRFAASRTSSTRAGFMQEVDKQELGRQSLEMGRTARKEMSAQMQHDAARAKRRASAAKKFPGVK